MNKAICIKEKTYRFDLNNFVVMYSNNDEWPDEFNLLIKDSSGMTLNDLKDLNKLTSDMLRHIEEDKTNQ